MTEMKKRDNPFPGLRPFRPEEAHLFFGREDQIADIVQRLRRNRFVAVVGASGSGKSSLVNAGLLPALDKGLPTRYGTKWRIAVLRPGNAPIRNLVDALGQPGILGPDDEDEAALQATLRATLLDTALRRSALGLLDAAAQILLPKGENLLVVVDQFEELFRFKEEAQIRSEEAGKARDKDQQETKDPNEAAAFVKLLLEAARSERAPIYIMLTMRSDYLGDCVQFRDLPEAINDGQFLVPRMTRDQRQMAIEGPVAIGKGLIKKRLVQRLLNEMGNNLDQLPIMQHALMRTWDYWSDQRDGEPLDIEHYEAIGTMARALSQHADEVYNELPKARQEIAERMFKRLTEKGKDIRGVRRPTQLDQLCIVCQADEEEVKAVIEAFRRPDRSLLMPEAGKPLTLDTFIDISHESLMRVWERLKVWVDEEAEGVALYRRLAETAALEAQGKASLWHDTDLHLALDFHKKSKPSAAWAGNDEESFDRAMSFLENSRIENRKRLWWKIARYGFIVVLLFLVIVVYAVSQGVRANEAEAEVVELKEEIRIDSVQTNDNSQHIDALENTVRVREDTIRVLRDRNDSLKSLVNPFLSGHQGAVQSVAFSPDGQTLASATAGPSINVWDVTLPHPRLVQRQPVASDILHTVRSVAFSRDGTRLASGNSDGTIGLWTVETGQPLESPPGHQISVRSVAFSPDGTRLASGSNDHTIILWDLEGSQPPDTLKGHTDWVNSVAFSPDGTRLASASADATIILWNLETGQPLGESLQGHRGLVTSVAFSPDGTRLASGSADATIIVWNVETGQPLGESLQGHRARVTSVAFNSDGTRLASASRDHTVRLWNLKTGRLLKTFHKHTDWVNSVAFSPTDTLLASGSGDHTVGIWKVEN